MSQYTPDSSGIYSLSGFSYQMRVFVLHLLSIKADETVEFETWDDITIGKITNDTLDASSDKFRSLIHMENGITAIQAKRTTLNESTCKQILFNWMLLENSGTPVQRYMLYTDKAYGNKDIVFDVDVDTLYSEVQKTTKNRKAAIRKVKESLSNKDDFIRVYKSIQSKYEFVDLDIDEEIMKAGSEIFHKAGVIPYVYEERISDLLNHITVQILDKINAQQPYSINYAEFMSCVEDISQRVTNEYIHPSYSDFKKLNSTDFSSLSVSESRECTQLKACDLPLSLIRQYLVEKGYYQNVRIGYMEINKKSCIEDIEETAFDNYEIAKHDLKVKNTDTPYNRLSKTTESSNSYACNDQIRHGACIFLTRAEETTHQISWEDADNAKN